MNARFFMREPLKTLFVLSSLTSVLKARAQNPQNITSYLEGIKLYRVLWSLNTEVSHQSSLLEYGKTSFERFEVTSAHEKYK